MLSDFNFFSFVIQQSYFISLYKKTFKSETEHRFIRHRIGIVSQKRFVSETSAVEIYFRFTVAMSAVGSSRFYVDVGSHASYPQTFARSSHQIFGRSRNDNIVAALLL